MAKRNNNAKTLRHISANPGIRSAYRKELEALIKEMHEDVKAAVLAQYQSSLARIVPNTGRRAAQDAVWRDPADILADLCAAMSRKWVKRFESISGKTARGFLKKVFRHVKTSRTNNLIDMGFNIKINKSRLTDPLFTAMVNENVNLIQSIPEQYLYRVRINVQRTISAGGNTAELERALMNDVYLEKRRAALIARDQTAKATQALAKSTDVSLGITEGIWMHIPGRKESRPSHVKFDGMKFDLNKGLYDPDAHGKGRGAWVKPGELIMCMCSYRPIIPDTWRA